MRKTPTTIVLALLFTFAYSLHAQQEDTAKLKSSYFEVNDYVEDNEGCLKCHGEQKFKLEDSFGRTVTQPMYPERFVDRDNFYSSVHKSFSCTDCHSYDLFEFPHPIDARLEEKLLCMDCHGYDESFAQYHFEDIEAEYMESTHNMEGFSCWKCHDPHSYKAFMRTATDIEEAILYDNQMCLSCHADYSQFMLLSDKEEINVVDSHDWLPNQIAHFRSVRCIECHTAISDSILIAHKIMPKADAVKNCNECHSSDSRLMHTLYKFQIKEERKAGFANGIILNNAYVIGANQNVVLNWLSFLVFGLTFLVILFHSILRILKLKDK